VKANYTIKRSCQHTFINRISYCFSPWGGFLNSEEVDRIKCAFQDESLMQNIFDLVALLTQADCKLFRDIQQEYLKPNRLLPVTLHFSACKGENVIISCLFNHNQPHTNVFTVKFISVFHSSARGFVGPTK
jgi:hypothetical protein